MFQALVRRMRLARLDRSATDSRLLDYAQRSFRVARRTPIDEVRFVVFDTETTGIDVERSRLLSLAAVGVRHRGIALSDRFEATFSGAEVGEPASVVLHQLVTADLEGGREAEDGVLAFLDFAQDGILVGHHVGFDIALVNRVLARLGPLRVYNHAIDTLRLHQRLGDGPRVEDARARPQARTLDAVCEAYGLDLPMRHSAAGDALATAQLFLALLHRAKRRGIRTIGALLDT